MAKNYRIEYMDSARTMGVVRVDLGIPILGWSRDLERGQVHVMSRMCSQEWRGTDLEETIERALSEVDK